MPTGPIDHDPPGPNSHNTDAVTSNLDSLRLSGSTNELNGPDGVRLAGSENTNSIGAGLSSNSGPNSVMQPVIRTRNPIQPTSGRAFTRVVAPVGSTAGNRYQSAGADRTGRYSSRISTGPIDVAEV